ncbi:hypothetical protein FH609_004200 [Streptomyces sp. 3MP-14]|uniref:Uncharacterized protein n=1 Tax=Streptomyces mimosae TaxID=2586635 RepID=A0A5N6A2D6_9ACTN|nr:MULTISPECIES: hypothetical protein [Streptomyces]KAB8162934.1 hypothetical protein FH607_020060 [Streptomyces mimosae]KAB8179148.1 hypothetical protein FH609_004200 [Streptomyces sp. 3MP-14]
MTDPIQGRILPPDEPLPRRLARPWFREEPDPAPAEEPVAERPYEAPPDVLHVHVTITPGTDVSPVEADVRPWWRPAWTLRTAILGAIGLMPIPGIGAPAGRWALTLGDIQAEASMGAAWVIGGAAVAGALANDRRVRNRPSRWDPDERAYRPGWVARAILCAAVAGAALTLPLADGLVYVLTGVNP